MSGALPLEAYRFEVRLRHALQADFHQAHSPDAEILTRNDVRIARWKDAGGKLRTAEVRTGLDGKDRIILTSGVYFYRYRDAAGVKRVVSMGCTDRTAAQAVAANLRRRKELVQANVISASEDAASNHANCPLARHFDGYEAHLRAKGCAPRRISQVRARLNRIAADCEFSTLMDMKVGAVERWLVAQQDAGMAAGTRNGYREALVGFGNWCRRTHRLTHNPFLDVPIADAKADRRLVRRALTEEELVRLLRVARSRPLNEAMLIRRGKRRGKAIANVRPEVRARLEEVGLERALMYKTLVLTGLRKGELASITVGDVELDAATPHLILKAGNEKNRQGAEIPLRADLAADLRSMLAMRLKALRQQARIQPGMPIPERLPPTMPLFRVPACLIRILNRDLVAAGIASLVKDERTGRMTVEKRDARGRSVDVHALRMTFGTHLSKAGLPLRTAQASMRHSKPELTANLYSDPKLLDVAGAIQSLPALPLDSEPAQSVSVVAEGGALTPDCQKTASPLALLLAPAGDHSGAREGKSDHEGPAGGQAEAEASKTVKARKTKKNGQRCVKNRQPAQQRVMGVEPTTFTLAT